MCLEVVMCQGGNGSGGANATVGVDGSDRKSVV